MNDQLPIIQQPAEDEINLLELLYVLVKRKRLIAGITGAVAVFSIAWSLLLPSIYTANAKILPPQKDVGGGMSAALGQLGGLAAMAGLGGLGGSADLYVSILKSRSVADAVIKRLNLQQEFKAKNLEATRGALNKSVNVQAGKDGIITVYVNSRKPELAAQLANTLVDELGRRSVQLNLTRASTDRAFLEKRLEVVKEDLKKAEEALKAFSEKNKALKVDSQLTATIEGIAKMRAEIVAKEVQLASLRSYQTDESPEVKVQQAALARLRAQMAGMTGGGKSDDAILTVGSVPSLGLQYARLMRDLKTQEAIYEQLTKQYELAKVAEAKDSSSLQILDEAVVPVRKSKPKRSLIVVVATASAFLFAVVVSFVLEYGEKMKPEERERWEALKGQLRFGS